MSTGGHPNSALRSKVAKQFNLHPFISLIRHNTRNIEHRHNMVTTRSKDRHEDDAGAGVKRDVPPEPHEGPAPKHPKKHTGEKDDKGKSDVKKYADDPLKPRASADTC